MDLKHRDDKEPGVTDNRAAEPHAVALHIGRPNNGERAVLFTRLGEILDRNWLTNDGPVLAALETRLADYLGVRHCVCVSNGTVGLQILIRALGLRGEVILPSFSFVATAHALTFLGLQPVFCDIDPTSHLLDPALIDALITPQTTAICGVHLWGQPCAVDALSEIATRRGLRLFYDAAHAFGSAYHGRKIGQFGDAEVFSFHATKVFNTLEGGAVTTNDDALAERLRMTRNFGFGATEHIEMIGTNGKMHEFSAAVGLTNFESLDAFIACNRRNYIAYEQLLAGLPGVRMLNAQSTDVRNFQYVVVEIDEAAAGVHRDTVMAALRDANILARRYFWPGIHRMAPYRRDDLHLPNTELISDRVLLLPTGTSVGESDIKNIGRIIRGVLRRDSVATLRPTS